MTSGVYLLRDPINGVVRYVGQAKDVETRLKLHWNRQVYCRTNRWCEELAMQGLRPSVDVVTCNTDALDKLERILIRRHDATVINGTYGGRVDFVMRKV
jgi:excinuclease UvrABC nuclease subunit